MARRRDDDDRNEDRDRPSRTPKRDQDDERPRKKRRREDDDEETPRKRRRRDEEVKDDAPRRKSDKGKGGNARLLIGLAGGAAVLLFGTLIVIFAVNRMPRKLPGPAGPPEVPKSGLTAAELQKKVVGTWKSTWGNPPGKDTVAFLANGDCGADGYLLSAIFKYRALDGDTLLITQKVYGDAIGDIMLPSGAKVIAEVPKSKEEFRRYMVVERKLNIRVEDDKLKCSFEGPLRDFERVKK